MFTNEQIYNLIPQRPPIVMIDTIESVGEDNIQTALTIRADNIFVRNNCLQEGGLIEHIAQSAAALAGYATYMQNQPPKVGFIGEIKHFVCNYLPPINTTLHTTVQIRMQMQDISLVEATTRCDQREVASCQLKIFINN